MGAELNAIMTEYLKNATTPIKWEPIQRANYFNLRGPDGHIYQVDAPMHLSLLYVPVGRIQYTYEYSIRNVLVHCLFSTGIGVR